MGWIIFRGKDDPPDTRFSMVEISGARLVPQPPEEDGLQTVAIFQGNTPGIIAKRNEVQYFDKFDDAWQGCQDALAGG